MNEKRFALLAKIAKIRKYLNANVFEREQETDGILQTILAGSTCLFLGDAGTAKTNHIRLASNMFGMSLFDVLISPSTKPEHIFGIPDIPALAKKGIQRFKTKGYAPASNILFLDEVFKAGGPILNPMLWLVNEHEFRNGDEGVVKCPIKAVFAASNEVPNETELRPFYDRFILRFNVEYLRSENNMKKMFARNMMGHNSEKPEPLSYQDTLLLRKMTRRVQIPAEIQDAVIKIRDQVMRACNTKISDRRMAKALKIIQANALLHKRMTAELIDTEVVANIFWDKPEHLSKVRAIVLSNASSDISDLLSYEEIAEDIWQNAVKTGNMEEAKKKLSDIHKSTKAFDTGTGKSIARRIQERLTKVNNIINQRGDFVILELFSANKIWFKLSTATAALYTKEQIRSVGFHHLKKGDYWWHDGPGAKPSRIKRIKFRRRLKIKIKETLRVEPQIKRIQ